MPLSKRVSVKGGLFVSLLLLAVSVQHAESWNVNIERIHRARLARESARKASQDTKTHLSIREEGAGGENVEPQVPEEMWYTQTLDHFRTAESDYATFQQRYYVNDTFWKGNTTSPRAVFLYIGGEAALTPTRVTRGEIVDFAQSHNGLLVALEHRFYGKSVPYMNYNTTNLASFLSSQQALADIDEFKSFINEQYNVDNSTAWISVGGSYPGALSAWLRVKYPQTVSGALASSAPVLAKANFYEYDQVVAASAGEACANVIRNITTAVENKLKSAGNNSAAVYSEFTCPKNLEQVEFLYILADVVAYSVQYGSRDTMCNALEKTPTYDGYVQWAKYIFNTTGNPCEGWNIASFTSTKAAEDQNMRQWMFQSCNEFGYFQVAPKDRPLRSKRITLAWHYHVCDLLFGTSPSVRPHIDYTNGYYGGDEPKGTRIYFANGSQDPWKALSVTKDISPWLPWHVIDGTAHTGDLSPARSSDPPDLTATRKVIKDYILNWASPVGQCGAMGVDCQNGICGPKGKCVCDSGYTGDACGKKEVSLGLGILIGAGAGVLVIGALVGCLVGRVTKKTAHSSRDEEALLH